MQTFVAEVSLPGLQIIIKLVIRVNKIKTLFTILFLFNSMLPLTALPFIHSSNYVPMHSPICSLIYSVIHPLIRSFIHLLIHSFVLSFIHSFVYVFILSFFNKTTNPLFIQAHFFHSSSIRCLFKSIFSFLHLSFHSILHFFSLHSSLLIYQLMSLLIIHPSIIHP